MFDAFSYPLSVPTSTFGSLKEYIEKQPKWFHSYQFQDGTRTPGNDSSSKKLHHLCLPQRLDGLSLLDIGTFDGYFSFHAEARGASVTSTDKFEWDWPGSTARQNYYAVHSALMSKAQVREVLVENIGTDLPTAKFDVVLFLGVLYHAPNMLQYLEQVYSVTKTVCVLETFLDVLDQSGSQATFYAHSEMNNDGSTYWGPNIAAVFEMLKRVGFRNVHLMNLWDVNTRAKTMGESAQDRVRSGRGIFHAYR